jgi:hypothetical protein
MIIVRPCCASPFNVWINCSAENASSPVIRIENYTGLPVVGSSIISKATTRDTEEENTWVCQKLNADGGSAFLSATTSPSKFVSDQSVRCIFQTELKNDLLYKIGPFFFRRVG